MMDMQGIGPAFLVLVVVVAQTNISQAQKLKFIQKEVYSQWRIIEEQQIWKCFVVTVKSYLQVTMIKGKNRSIQRRRRCLKAMFNKNILQIVHHLEFKCLRNQGRMGQREFLLREYGNLRITGSNGLGNYRNERCKI